MALLLNRGTASYLLVNLGRHTDQSPRRVRYPLSATLSDSPARHSHQPGRTHGLLLRSGFVYCAVEWRRVDGPPGPPPRDADEFLHYTHLHGHTWVGA